MPSMYNKKTIYSVRERRIPGRFAPGATETSLIGTESRVFCIPQRELIIPHLLENHSSVSSCDTVIYIYEGDNENICPAQTFRSGNFRGARVSRGQIRGSNIIKGREKNAHLIHGRDAFLLMKILEWAAPELFWERAASIDISFYFSPTLEEMRMIRMFVLVRWKLMCYVRIG